MIYAAMLKLEGLGMRKILAHGITYKDAKELTKQGGPFLDFYEISRSYVSPKSIFHHP